MITRKELDDKIKMEEIKKEEAKKEYLDFIETVISDFGANAYTENEAYRKFGISFGDDNYPSSIMAREALWKKGYFLVHKFVGRTHYIYLEKQVAKPKSNKLLGFM